jgi:hypothetical protein
LLIAVATMTAIVGIQLTRNQTTKYSSLKNQILSYQLVLGVHSKVVDN